jgi:alkanesulfonate monooxygenase
VSIHLHWFLPTTGDSREIVGFGPTTARRAPSIDYLAQVAGAAELLGFEAVLTPTGTWCEDSWLTTAALSRDTRRLKFLVAFRPGLISPTLAAQQASTFQRITGGRLLLNIVTGGDAEEQRRFGDWLDHDRRYDRTAEFITVLRGAWTGAPFDFTGEHYEIAGASTAAPPDPLPEIFFGGASPAAERVAARHADVYLTWGETPDQVAERIDRMRDLAARAGRELRFGIRLHVISRDRAEDAWAVTDRMLEAMSDDVIALAQGQFLGGESVGQQRMAALHGGSRDNLVVSPNLWAGFGLVRSGAGTALVGSHREVADRIAEYHRLGIDHFILSGQPHLEEAYWFGEGVLPLLADDGLLSDGAPGTPGAATSGPATSGPALVGPS